MTPAEVYETKRQNFLKKSVEEFRYLVSDFGFAPPKHLKSEQSNGVVIRDELIYKRSDVEVKLVNAYHPVDYGFEIRWEDLETGRADMLHYVLKENQDVEQSYLPSAAQLLKNSYGSRIKIRE